MANRSKILRRFGKPVGWTKESFRHSLASRGVSTNRYFSSRSDKRKGNRAHVTDPILKSLYARGYDDKRIAALFPQLVPLIEHKNLVKTGYRPLINVPHRQELEAGVDRYAPFENDYPTYSSMAAARESIPTTPIYEAPPELPELPPMNPVFQSAVPVSSPVMSEPLPPPMPMENIPTAPDELPMPEKVKVTEKESNGPVKKVSEVVTRGTPEEPVNFSLEHEQLPPSATSMATGVSQDMGVGAEESPSINVFTGAKNFAYAARKDRRVRLR